ncbi:DUF1611 domain-containing protein [Halanaeroarchaeum sulfurireducens]|uniref:DUF1611 domain-containing protein n=1 Tax=Halanaeroarchaeum sulfurireducens TaxID=1604004 RepID=A0A0N9N511_9EURY|nr:DUF1611 domain-containing protein [Halanaeroarchaeum sulfurireducens]ALG82772.1 hypothetical protein HLASA_1893 [Halanaeroarchaeum sulfurireducens]
MRVALLAHEKFPDDAKTAVGVLRYADFDVAAVLDRDLAGDRVSDHLAGVADAPIVAGMDELDEPVDALLIGIAPIGGGFDESWRPDVRAAIERGADVVAGLHYFLSEDEEFASLAAEHNVDLRDVRKPDEDLTVAEGVSGDVSAEVVLTVGTDCSTGKMTSSIEMMEAATARGEDAAFVPTGQTGIMIADWGHPIDRVVSDFTAGAVEDMIVERGDDHDYLFVEGQGSINHPAYSSVTLGILHGAMPDKLVLTHNVGQEVVHGYEDFALPDLDTVVDLYEDVAAPVHETEVVAGMINTSSIESDEKAREAVEAYSAAIGVPATDPVRFGAEEVLDAIL